VTRILAIDHGVRRIGVAVGDTETGMAFARAAIHRHGESADVHEIGRLASSEGVNRIVIGLPRNMDGSEGGQATVVRSFGARLAESVGLPVTYMDERLSSWAAEQELRGAGKAADRRSGALDSAAARLILQEYLDAKEDR
jgi:putative Holliday junction resolvase